MRQSHQLKSYLIAFALVLTIPLLAGAIFAVWRFSESERARLMSMATDTGENIGSRVEQEISTRTAILQSLAATPSIYEDLTLFSQQARLVAGSTGIQIVLFDATGQQLVNTRAAVGKPLPMTADPDLIRDVVDRRTMVYVANLFVGKISQSEQVQVAVPVMRDGKVYRILGASILSTRLAGLVSEDLIGPLSATLLDRDGTVIARSRGPEMQIGKTFPDFAETFTEDEGTFWFSASQNEPFFAYYRRLPTSGWVVIAAISKAALDGPLFHSIKILAALIVGLAALAFGFAWLIARRLTFAHRSLIEAAAAVGDGRVPTPPVTALHEVNLAAAALAAASLSVNEHAEKLTDANLNLERRVRQRTEELMLQTLVIESKTALFETTLDTMNQGLMVIDAEGRVPICNLQARLLLDLSDAVLDRHPPFEEIAALSSGPDATGAAGDPIRLPHPSHSSPRLELVVPNGRLLEIRTAPIQRGGGFVQTFSDITEERETQILLEEARVAAEKANSAKSDFLANMSHEMRTPLNAILGYSELLLVGPHLEPDIRRGIQRIRDAGTGLLGLTNDVLDLGKIEAGVLDIRLEPFALADLVEQAVSIIRPTAEGKGLTLDVQLMADMDGLRLGDRDRLRQVLLNLLGNAVKFTPSGSVTLSLREEGHVLCFEVTDTGVGIPKEDWPKLFQRFQPLDLSINRSYEGAGLGLAISKHLTERMGGSIGFRSTAGKGSVFWFDLPLPHWHSNEAPAPVARHAAEVPVRILVAEDVVVNQELVRELLEAVGHAVDVVSTGREAIEAVLSNTYDLILMDVSMPDMDGLTATRHIRRRHHSKMNSAPIIACTARVLPDQIDAMRDAGIDAILFKPFSRKELYDTIDRMLGRDAGETPIGHQDDAFSSVPSLVSLLGTEVVKSALATFLVELQALESAEPSCQREYVELADRAHAMIATASMFDSTDLMVGCQALEDACRTGSDVDATLGNVRPLIHSALNNVTWMIVRLDTLEKSGDSFSVSKG